MGRSIRAARGDGSKAEVHEELNPSSPPRSRIVYFKDGRKVVFHHNLRIKTTFFAKEKARFDFELARRQRYPRTQCVDRLQALSSGEQIVGEEKIGRLSAVRTRITDGQMDLWYGPRPGCVMVRQEVQVQPGKRSIQTLESYALGEPDVASMDEEYRAARRK